MWDYVLSKRFGLFLLFFHHSLSESNMLHFCPLRIQYRPRWDNVFFFIKLCFFCFKRQSHSHDLDCMAESHDTEISNVGTDKDYSSTKSINSVSDFETFGQAHEIWVLIIYAYAQMTRWCVYILVWVFIYFPTLHMRAVKALTRLQGCAGSSGLLLLTNAISTIILGTGSLYLFYT